MAKETETEKSIPEKYRWDELTRKDGTELKKFYNIYKNHMKVYIMSNDFPTVFNF